MRMTSGIIIIVGSHHNTVVLIIDLDKLKTRLEGICFEI